MKDPDFSRPWQKRGQSIGGRKLPPRSARPAKIYRAAALPPAPPVQAPVPAPTIAKAKPPVTSIQITQMQFDRLHQAAAAAEMTVEQLLETIIHQQTENTP